jgi:hypothetical protein
VINELRWAESAAAFLLAALNQNKKFCTGKETYGHKSNYRFAHRALTSALFRARE